ncbi:MAG: DUF115 domain-containing protein [Bacteroidales bacterium]|nr:DUF115 domain-containing protein [Clostridium sp.]MCM1203837.1 DUF115 domain-containing protein [Bacteroidales bacterium]
MEQTKYMEKNMNVIRKRDEKLYQAIVKYVPGNPRYCPEQVPAKDGTEITRLTVDGKAWYINSQYRPLQEAVTFAEQYYAVIDFSVMVFLGFGNGILARQLRQSLSEHVTLLFYEPSAEIFLHTLQHYDVSDLLADENIWIAVRDLNEEKITEALYENVKFENYRFAIYDALPKYRQLFPEENQWLEDLYRKAVYNVIIYLNTRQDFGKSMAVNSIRNMRYLLNCNYRDDFNGVFPVEIPAVVVAAGPSLEKNVQVLKKMKGKAFIIAVDTALRYLAEQGIRPDLAITVDAEKPLRLFEPEEVRKMQLVIDSGASSQAAGMLSGQKLIFSGGNYNYYHDVFKLAGRQFKFLENGGSVATVAFSLLCKWGFKRIVLVGQDLALAPDKVHAGSDDVDLFKLDGDKIAIEGYYGETVYTTWDYDAYREWLEEKISEADCPEVINATEGGAKIAGAVQMPLQEVLDTYCKREFDFEEAIRNVPPAFAEEDLPGLLALWKGSVRNLEQLRRRFKEGIRLVEEEIRLISRGSYTKGDMLNIHKRRDKIFKECDAYVEIQLVDSMIAADEERILDDLYEAEASNDEEHCRLLEKLKKYMVSMSDAAEEARNLFQLVIDEMEK